MEKYEERLIEFTAADAAVTDSRTGGTSPVPAMPVAQQRDMFGTDDAPEEKMGGFA